MARRQKTGADTGEGGDKDEATAEAKQDEKKPDAVPVPVERAEAETQPIALPDAAKGASTPVDRSARPTEPDLEKGKSTAPDLEKDKSTRPTAPDLAKDRPERPSAKDLPEIVPPSPRDEPWPDATPPPTKPVPPASPRTTTETIAMPTAANLGKPPDMPQTTAPPPLALGSVEDPTHMPGPKDIPAGRPEDRAPPPGHVPPGDSRSLRRGN